jgi:nucleoside-diphosphate-sugar epimerase
VEANVLAAAAEVEHGAVFNVAGGTSTTVNEVIELLGEIAGMAPKVRRSDAVPGDVLRTGGSTRAIATATGWSPAVALPDGLEEQYRWAAAVLA